VLSSNLLYSSLLFSTLLSPTLPAVGFPIVFLLSSSLSSLSRFSLPYSTLPAIGFPVVFLLVIRGGALQEGAHGGATTLLYRPLVFGTLHGERGRGGGVVEVA
jgi:hypothetical protein